MFICMYRYFSCLNSFILTHRHFLLTEHRKRLFYFRCKLNCYVYFIFNFFKTSSCNVLSLKWNNMSSIYRKRNGNFWINWWNRLCPSLARKVPACMRPNNKPTTTPFIGALISPSNLIFKFTVLWLLFGYTYKVDFR